MPPPPIAPLPPHPPALTISTSLSSNCRPTTQVVDAKSLVADNLDRALKRRNGSPLEQSEEQRLATVRNLIASSFRPTRPSRDMEVTDEDPENEIYICSLYRHVTPVVQRGPSCGLIALNMALAHLTGINLDPADVLSQAVDLNFTKKGEMFSAENLLALARRLAPCEGKLLTREQPVDIKQQIIIEELRRGSVVLIPYDRDANSEPCQRGGQRAHWAALTGLVQQMNKREYESLKGDAAATVVDPIMSNVLHVKSDLFLSNALDNDQRNSTFVYAVHGRSVSCRLWSLDAILASNAQLISLDPQIVAVICEYVVPHDGIEAGLCGQVIILSKIR